MTTKLWVLQRPGLLEVFALSNIAFLGVDIYLAHSVNAFRHDMEWAPIVFSVVATVVLAAGFPRSERQLRAGWRRLGGLAVGWCAVVLGIAGLLFHLRSQFFELWTIKSLVYTAPFVAPLAYAGVGLLLIMNRMVDPRSPEWGRWVVFLAAGGVLGNFILTLCDHAQNGFFHQIEWLPVWVSALGAAALFSVVVLNIDRPMLFYCAMLLVLQFATGVLGFGLHVRANLHGESDRILQSFLYGAPAFAPLLLSNLSLLAALGLWGLWSTRERTSPRASISSPA